MSWVWRTLQCGLGHSFEKLMEKGSAPPDACPVCDALVEVLRPPHEAGADAHSDTVGAPLPRSERGKAIARFEQTAFVKPHFDDGKPMLTNLRDDVRVGESYVVPETVSTNETMRMTRDMIAAQEQAKRETPNGRQMISMGGGWGVADGSQLAALGPQNTFGRPIVDLKGKRA